VTRFETESTHVEILQVGVVRQVGWLSEGWPVSQLKSKVGMLLVGLWFDNEYAKRTPVAQIHQG
jgi:hypothetical protein